MRAVEDPCSEYLSTSIQHSVNSTQKVHRCSRLHPTTASQLIALLALALDFYSYSCPSRHISFQHITGCCACQRFYVFWVFSSGFSSLHFELGGSGKHLTGW